MENKTRIVEETGKRFQQIFEYIAADGKVLEEEDPNEIPPQGQDGVGEGVPPQEMPPQGGNPNAMGGQGPEGFDPQTKQDGDDNNAALPQGEDINAEDFEGQPGPDDDVVDITSLTDAQEQTNNGVEKLDDKFIKVIKTLDSFEKILRKNDEKINDLKSEIEKRNPTQIEKLGMQSTLSYPFSQPVDKYWKDKEANSNYRTSDDNNGVGQSQYVITKDDVEGNLDWRGIANTLDDDDEENGLLYNQTLKNVLGK